MSGSVLASITQRTAKAVINALLALPRTPSLYRGSTPTHTEQRVGQKEKNNKIGGDGGEGGRRSSEGDSKTHAGKILRMLVRIHSEEFLCSSKCL